MGLAIPGTLPDPGYWGNSGWPCYGPSTHHCPHQQDLTNFFKTRTGQHFDFFTDLSVLAGELLDELTDLSVLAGELLDELTDLSVLLRRVCLDSALLNFPQK